MKILNYGSLNLDYAYHVSHLVMEGETISASSQSILPGGKGLNQSIALAKVGTQRIQQLQGLPLRDSFYI